MESVQDIKYRFNPQSEQSRKVLGPLEGDIMEVVWESQGPLTVGVVHKALLERKPIAYTTVMTTMSRLARKRLLVQNRTSNTYSYAPTLPRADFERYVVLGIIQSLFEDYGHTVLDCLTEFLQKMEPEDREQVKNTICR